MGVGEGIRHQYLGGCEGALGTGEHRALQNRPRTLALGPATAAVGRLRRDACARPWLGLRMRALPH